MASGSKFSGRLSGLSPLEKLSRGYGFIAGEDGRKISSVHQVEPGRQITVHVRDGKILEEEKRTETDGKVEEI